MENASRRRASTAASRNSPIAVELLEHIQNVSDSMPNTKQPFPPAVVHLLCDDLRRIRQLLIDNPSRGQARDAFRHVGGFMSVIDILKAFEGYYNSETLSRDEKTDFFELLRADLDVLSEALNDHPGNRRFFTNRVHGGGWKALQQALEKSGVLASDNETYEQLLGQLFAFALADEEFSTIFRGIGRDGKRISQTSTDRERTADTVKATDHLDVAKNLRRRFSGKEILRNPETFPLILAFWKTLLSDEEKASLPLSTAVLAVLQIIADIAIRNAASIHGTEAITLLLPLLFPSSDKRSPDSMNHALLRDLASSLMPFGINNLDDAYTLFRLASSSDVAAEFLLKSLQTSSPPLIQFDLSLHGYSCIELDTMGRTFPPTSNSTGYTLMAWFRISTLR